MKIIMTSDHLNYTGDAGQTARTITLLRRIYLIRAAFSVGWVALICVFANSSMAITSVLLVIYPAWDVFGTLMDLHANNNSSSETPQFINMGISSVATVAVVLTLQKGIPIVLMAFGIWAAFTGSIQVIMGSLRRKMIGGQWPIILSGVQSVMAGSAFFILAHHPVMGVLSIAGYAGFGAFYYLLAAIRLNKKVKQDVN